MSTHALRGNLDKAIVNTKVLLKFPPKEADALALEKLGAVVYSDGFKVQSVEFNKTGRKVVIVTDRVPEEDLERGEIASGVEGKIYDDLLNWCMVRKKPDITIKQVVLFNWQYSSINENDKRSGGSAEEAKKLYFARLERFVNRYKPDSVVVCGLEAFEYVTGRLTGDTTTRHRMYMNRTKKVMFGKHECQLVGTLDLHRPTSWDKKYTGTFPFLLGFLSRGILAGLEGKNRYTVKLPHKYDTDFVYINTINKFKAFLKKLRVARRVAIDTEGQWGGGRIVNTLYSVQFSFEKNRAYFIPYEHKDTPFSVKEIAYIKRHLRDYFETGESFFHIYQNGKYDITQFHSQLGVRFYNHRVYDIQGGEFALDENRKQLAKPCGIKPYALDFICEQYGCDIYRKIGFSKGDRGAIGKTKLPGADDDGLMPIPKKYRVQFGKRRVINNGLIEYGCYDVLTMLHIVDEQIKAAKDAGNGGFIKFVCEQLSDTTLAFAGMEFLGAKIDKRHLFILKAKDGPVTSELNKHLLKFRDSKAAIKVNKYLMDKAGVPQGNGLWGGETWLFDINKAKHQQLLFFSALKLKPTGVTKTGDGQVGKAFQAAYAHIDEVALYNKYKKLLTLRDNFVTGMYKRMQSDADCLHDGHVRSNFGYTTVTTGRTSANSPNLQNIPNRGPLAKLIKRLFIAIYGNILLDVDYSANEIKEWANESGDKSLINSFYQGLKLRTDLRVLSYTNQAEAAAWTAYKITCGWFDVKKDADEYENKLKLIKKCNNKITQLIGTTELELALKGDIHKVNAAHFFSTTILQVTEEQRDIIKPVVFGVVYGKGKAGLSTTLDQTEKYAQYLIDTLFKMFPQGAKYLTDTHKEGKEALYVANPIGMRRHLFGYLHNRVGVVNAMNRRGPNSKIQGMASSIGVSSVRLMQKNLWHFFVKHGVNFPRFTISNYVHDSTKSSIPIGLLPIYLYLIEHASTTQIHKRYREVFGYKMSIGLELEFQIGPASSELTKWNFMSDSLRSIVEKTLDWQTKELNYEYAEKERKRIMKTFDHNWAIIKDIRLAELKESIKSRKPDEHMLMNQDNARSLELII